MFVSCRLWRCGAYQSGPPLLRGWGGGGPLPAQRRLPRQPQGPRGGGCHVRRPRQDRQTPGEGHLPQRRGRLQETHPLLGEVGEGGLAQTLDCPSAHTRPVPRPLHCLTAHLPHTSHLLVYEHNLSIVLNSLKISS